MSAPLIETLGKGLRVAGEGVSKFVGNPVVRKTAQQANNILGQGFDKAKQGVEALANSDLGKNAAALAVAAAPAVASNIMSNLETPSTDTDSKDEKQTVNLASLKDAYNKFSNRANKSNNNETSQSVSNPQDAQDDPIPNTVDSTDNKITPDTPLSSNQPSQQDLAHEQIKAKMAFDKKDEELAKEIDANTNHLLQEIVSQADSIAALRKSQLASVVPSPPSSSQPAQQSYQQPTQPYQQPAYDIGQSSNQNSNNQNASNFF